MPRLKGEPREEGNTRGLKRNEYSKRYQPYHTVTISDDTFNLLMEALDPRTPSPSFRFILGGEHKSRDVVINQALCALLGKPYVDEKTKTWNRKMSAARMYAYGTSRTEEQYNRDQGDVPI